jgi:hypothetical protein
MPCPVCFAKVSLIDAADDTLEVGGEPYGGNYICPNCGTELAKIPSPEGGTPGWAWQRKVPVAGKTGRIFSDQELDLLVEEHDAITRILEDPEARSRHCTHPRVDSGAKVLRLVTPARLAAYLERYGWGFEGPATDETQQGWKKAGGKYCTTRMCAVADAEGMAWDVESVALGEDCSVLRVLVGLLAVEPPP